MTRRETLLTLMSALLPAASPAAASGSDPTLAAIRQPIRDGEGAAGVMLGEPEAAVMRVLGRGPDRREDHPEAELRLDLWEVAPADREWIAVLALAYLLGGAGVAAVRGAAMRRSAGPAPYGGRTQRGYGLFDGAARLRQLYGQPDADFTFGPGAPVYLWYRRAGLVVLPEIQADYRVAQFVVLPSDLTTIEARRLVLAQ